MREFFGVVTLLMALMFMAGWVRSLTIGDTLVLTGQDQTLYYMNSESGNLMFSRQNGVALTPRSWFKTPNIVGWFSYSDGCPGTKHLSSSDSRIQWIRQFIGFKIGVVERFDYEFKLPNQEIVVIPYWAIVLPLGFISFLLLFKKPRKSDHEKNDESISVEEAE